MTSDFPNNPRGELEARLTALLLGELPADEAATLRQAIEQDADLAKLYARLKHTIELVRETAASPAEQSADQPAPLSSQTTPGETARAFSRRLRQRNSRSRGGARFRGRCRWRLRPCW